MRAWVYLIIALLAGQAWAGRGTAILADIIQLKNGKKLEGKVIKRDNGIVLIDSGRVRLTLSEASIERIQTGAAEEATLPAAEELAKAGKFAAAYEAYQKLADQTQSSPAARQTAQTRMRELVQQAVDRQSAQYRDLLKQQEYDRCLQGIKRDRIYIADSQFDALISRLIEGNVHLLKAGDLIDKIQWTAALAELNNIETLDIECPGYDACKGTVLLNLRSYAEAGLYLRRAWEDSPNNPALLSGLITALVNSDQPKPAIEVWEQRAKSFDGSPYFGQIHSLVGKAYRIQALSLQKMGQTAQARPLYDKGFKISAPSSELYEEARDFYKAVGDQKAAEQSERLLAAQLPKQDIEEASAGGGGALPQYKVLARQSMGKRCIGKT